MNLSADVDLEEFVMTKDDLSGADIKAVCTEAGLLALRERRMQVTKVDFTSAREKVSTRIRYQNKELTMLDRYCTERTRGHQKAYICSIHVFSTFLQRVMTVISKSSRRDLIM